MSEYENPARSNPGHEVTIEDVRQLMGASTPHFALQIRNRLIKLVDGLPVDHPARIEGDREIARLTRLAYSGETRGTPSVEGMRPLPAISDDPVVR
jgi:hypothetical protein